MEVGAWQVVRRGFNFVHSNRCGYEAEKKS
jgi:hypothetical protein